MDHRSLFTKKQIDSLRPAEAFVFEAPEGYELKEFLGSCRWAEPRDFSSLEDAIAEYKLLKAERRRPMIYAFRHRPNGERCLCFIPN